MQILKYITFGLGLSLQYASWSVYDRFFLFAWLNLPNVLISVAKIFFDSDFPSLCFDVPKASNFTSGGVQNRDTKNRRLGMIVTSIQESKPREKQISQSFLVQSALLGWLGGWRR